MISLLHIKAVRGRLPPLVLPSLNLHRPLASVNLHRPTAHAHVRPPPPPLPPRVSRRRPASPLQSAALPRIVHLHSIPRISSARSPARRRPFLRDQELAAGVSAGYVVAARFRQSVGSKWNCAIAVFSGTLYTRQQSRSEISPSFSDPPNPCLAIAVCCCGIHRRRRKK